LRLCRHHIRTLKQLPLPISDYSGDGVIPESVTYNGQTYSVTIIGEAALLNCSNLTSITIGYGATSIGSYAFEYCSVLASVILPDCVTNIGIGAPLNAVPYPPLLSLTELQASEDLTSTT
jgi:hypothetical protein